MVQVSWPLPRSMPPSIATLSWIEVGLLSQNKGGILPDLVVMDKAASVEPIYICTYVVVDKKNSNHYTVCIQYGVQ